MTSSYNDIYSRFFNKVSDYDLAGLIEPNATERMRGWLQSALSHSYINRIFETYSADDEIAEIDYTLKSSIDDVSDKNFVEELLCNAIIVEWVSPRLLKSSLLNQMNTNSKESKFYSQATHISELRALNEEAYNKVRSMLRDKGYIYNSYLGNV